MNRQSKLHELAERQKQIPPKLDVADFDESITKLKGALDDGVTINNLDDLLDVLSTIQAFHKEVVDLKDVAAKFNEITFPDSVEVNGLQQLIRVLDKIPGETKVVNKINNTNTIDEYQPANTDEFLDTEGYYGYLHPTGKWYILKIITGMTDAVFKYAAGSDKYVQNWGKRKSQSYTRFDEIAL